MGQNRRPRVYLHAYFHIFLRSRVLKRKNFLTIDFPQCYSFGKLRPFGRVGFKSVALDPLTIWNIFYYFFGNFLHDDTHEIVDLVNKERSNTHSLEFYCNQNFKSLAGMLRNFLRSTISIDFSWLYLEKNNKTIIHYAYCPYLEFYKIAHLKGVLQLSSCL